MPARNAVPVPERHESSDLALSAGAADRLLAATAALIIERETTDIPIADIAIRAQANSALIKYYFRGKSGLLLALLCRDAEKATAEMRELLALDAPATVKMRLHLTGIMNAYARSPYLNRLLHDLLSARDAEIETRVVPMILRPVLDCQSAILAQGKREGAFRDIDPNQFYFFAVGACDQFMHSERLRRLAGVADSEPAFRGRYMDSVVDWVLRALAA